MYELTIKFLKNLFLFIMSILKTLSSNYTIILILFSVLFYCLLYLSERKLVLPCNNCESGSWFYKCSRNTGFGTRTCKTYTFVINTTEDFIHLVNNGVDKYLKVILILIEHTSRVLKKYVTFIDNLTGVLSLLFPPWLLFKYLIKPVQKDLFKTLRKAKKNIKNFSCPFILPVLNTKLDICGIMSTTLYFLLDLINVTFDTLLEISSMIAKLLFTFIKTMILDRLVKLISAAFKIIVKNILSLMMKSTQLLYLIKKPLNVIFNIPIYQYFILVINSLLDYILNTVPGGSIIKQSPSIILGIISFIIFIIFILPIIGGFFALFPLIKSLIFIILGLDDNNDLKLLVFAIYNRIMSFFTTTDKV